MRLQKLISAVTVIASISLFIYSCKPDNDPIPVNPIPNADVPINKLYEALKPQPQSFTITAGTIQTITGAKGTGIKFYANSFKTQSGTVITSGTINIQLTEALTPGQMIMNRVSTVTNANNLLQSGGSVNIVATRNGVPVYTNGYQIAFKQPAANTQPMALFSGIVASGGLEAGAVTWSNDSTNTVNGTTFISIDSMGGSYYYIFDTCTNFNWVNCDQFSNLTGPKTDVTVVMPDGTYTDSVADVVIIIPSLNIVAGMRQYNSATHAFSLGSSFYHLPLGTDIKIAVIGMKNNVYFFQLMNNITVTNGMTLTATPANTTLSNIQSVLSGL